MVADRLDVAARLAEGRAAVEHTQSYVQACHALGYQHRDLTAHPAQKSPHPRPSSSEDPSHVVEAIQALRTDKDPSRAQGLLNDYLKTPPNGVLSEDALALSIEAASAQHDPKAADYAKRYLAKFPHGKYRALASRALVQAGH